MTPATALTVAGGVLLCAALGWLAATGTGSADMERLQPAAYPPVESLATLEQGRAYYVQLCMDCHGARGDGQGEWAYRVTPRPADLRGARVRARSEAELDRAIAEGVPGTPMIGTRLSAAQRHQLASYVRHLGAEHAARR
jgi:mono/diheme cytochrome c family protein